MSYIEKLSKVIKTLKEENKKLAEALEVYADDKMWLPFNEGKPTVVEWQNDSGAKSKVTSLTHYWVGHVNEKHPNETAKSILKELGLK